MKFLFTIFELPTEREINSFEKEFDSYEDAEIWAKETYNTDSYCCVEEIE